MLRRTIPNHLIGKLAKYMHQHNIRYGFISTYNATVFVKRTDFWQFQVSPPVSYDSEGTRPSTRECFLYFSSLLTDEEYSTDYNPRDPRLAELVSLSHHPSTRLLLNLLIQISGENPPELRNLEGIYDITLS